MNITELKALAYELYLGIQKREYEIQQLKEELSRMNQQIRETEILNAESQRLMNMEKHENLSPETHD